MPAGVSSEPFYALAAALYVGLKGVKPHVDFYFNKSRIQGGWGFF